MGFGRTSEDGADRTCIASAIVDDETYDWHAVIDRMIRSKGEPVAVSEGALRRARVTATQTLNRAADSPRPRTLGPLRGAS